MHIKMGYEDQIEAGGGGWEGTTMPYDCRQLHNLSIY